MISLTAPTTPRPSTKRLTDVRFCSFMCLHSQRRRRIRRVLPVRLRTIVERSARQLRCTHSRRAGRSHHRSAGVEKLRAKAPRAADMVVRARSVRDMYTVCGRVQREPSLLRRPTGPPHKYRYIYYI